MKTRKTLIGWSLAAAVAALVAGCASGPGMAELNEMARKVAQASFRDEGIVKAAAVLNADETARLCSEADAAGKPLDEATAKRLETTNLKAIRWPSDGKFLGDWKQGEAIAQSGRGLTFTDSASTANGGNCYNCHQISPQEISYGTIGPSLYQYGKLRGVSDPASPAAEPILKYTWAKIWNSNAFMACSGMPRFGHAKLLDDDQIRHVMALLLDPKSPVNTQ